MMYKSLLLYFVFLNLSFVKTENMKLCYYSRYVLLFFRSHELYFKKNFENFQDDPSTLVELQTYADSLRGHGLTVLAIIDDLMSQKDQAVGLMAVNLYLNNLSGLLLARTFDSGYIPSDSPNNKVNAAKRELKKSGFAIVESLKASVYENCAFWSKGDSHIEVDMITRDPKTESPQGYNRLKALLPERHTLNVSYTDALSDSTMEMKYLLKPFWNRPTFGRYHPKQMLFYGLLFRGDQVDLFTESEPDSLQLLRGVTLTTQMEDDTYPDVEILFFIAQRCYDARYIQSYQQQVLAATAHPVLSAVGWYARLVELVFYAGDGKFKDVATRAGLFGKRIDDLGDSVLNAFVAFIRLEIFPENVLDNLKKTALELDDLVKCVDKKNIQSVTPKWTGQIYRRCSGPMLLNKLRVTKPEEFISVDSEENCTATIDALAKKTEKVGEYVKALEKHKDLYRQNTTDNPFFSHEDMFLYGPEFDIIQENKYDFCRVDFLARRSSFSTCPTTA